jgi:glycosyltransferase involved in cell wall biosynthesis
MDENALRDVTLSVLVPAYNEEDGIPAVLDELQRVMAKCPMRAFEIIVIDDGSSDGTSEKVRKHPDVRLLRHPSNRGYGAALKTGVREARYDWICITDADGTYPNERIPDLLTEAVAGADMVIGARTAPGARHSVLRRIPKLFLRRYAEWVAHAKIDDLNSGLRVFRRESAGRLLQLLPDGFSFTTTITLAMLTNHQSLRFVSIQYADRIGRSKIRPIRDTLNFLLLIIRIGTYFAPFRIFMPMAAALFALFVVSFAYDVVMLRNLTDKTLIFLTTSMNIGMFGLLADAIQRRIGR